MNAGSKIPREELLRKALVLAVVDYRKRRLQDACGLTQQSGLEEWLAETQAASGAGPTSLHDVIFLAVYGITPDGNTEHVAATELFHRLAVEAGDIEAFIEAMERQASALAQRLRDERRDQAQRLRDQRRRRKGP